LLTTTITDELRMGTNFKGKVIGMSLKDRGAILPAGHFANWAFWYSKTGSFISSSFFYGSNDYIMGWDLYRPKAIYNESLEDNPYEGKLYDSTAPVFPT
jgi:hypothetical protein